MSIKYKIMIVDVITSGVQRIAPIVDGPGVDQHEVLDIYTSPSPALVTHYADAELCDIRAFGLTSGLVKVMGGIASFAGVVAVPAAPRVFNFFVNEPLRGLGFAPDGTSLGVLYQSCLVVVSIIHPDTRHAYYFGQNHTDIFTGVTLTDNFAYVTSATSNEILRFSLHGPDFELERVTIGASVRTLLSEMDEWVSYQPLERAIRYHGRFAQDPIRDIPLPPMVGDVFKIVPTLDKSYVWCITNTELVIAARETQEAAVRPIQIGCTADNVLTLPYQHGIIIAWHDVVTHKLHLNSYEFNPVGGDILHVSYVSVDFQTAPRAIALPASPLTRFNARYPLMILQPIRRVHVIFNAHLYPDADADAEENEDTDDEDTDDEDDESEADDEESDDDDDEVVEATFYYPQPPSGLQQIIRRTRDYLPTLSETFRPWTPDEFGRVLTAARLCTGKRIAMLSQQTAMLAYARENHRILADAVRTVVQDFAKFYNGSASMGLFDPCPNEDSFAPYAEKIHSAREHTTMDPDNAEKFILELLQLNSSSTIGDPLGFEALEFKVDTSYQLGVHFKGMEADTVHAVNTGVISTLNCFMTEVQDLIQSIRLQRKLLKYVSREISQMIIPEETSCSKRKIDEHSYPAKRLAPDE